IPLIILISFSVNSLGFLKIATTKPRQPSLPISGIKTEVLKSGNHGKILDWGASVLNPSPLNCNSSPPPLTPPTRGGEYSLFTCIPPPVPLTEGEKGGGGRVGWGEMFRYFQSLLK